MEMFNRPLWLTRPPEKPLHLPENRVKNAFAAFWHELRRDGKSLQLGWEETLNLFRGLAWRHCRAAPYLPLDDSVHAATAFAVNLHAEFAKRQWNLSQNYLKSCLSRGVGFGNWLQMAFVLSLYRDFAEGQWEFDGVRLTKPAYSHGTLVLPGTTNRRYDMIAGRYFQIFKSEGAWYAMDRAVGIALYGYSRGWGYSLSDCIAWQAAKCFLSMGPAAWNSYSGIAAGAAVGKQSEKRFLSAEKKMVRWIERDSVSAIRKRFSAMQ